jgi:hypothetical protein
MRTIGQELRTSGHGRATSRRSSIPATPKEANMNAAETVGAFQKAMGSGDFSAARKLMHDDMTFKGPFESFSRPEPYLESLKKLHSIVKGVKVHKMFVDGEDVCQLYDMETNSPAGTAFISEWLTVHKGKIASIRVVFDARPFAAMFAK